MAKSNDSKRTIATGSLLVPYVSHCPQMPRGVLEPAPDPISFSAEQAEQVQALYDLLSKEGKPRLVAQDGETALELPDAVCELLLKVAGWLQQGKAISIGVAEEPSDPV
jgi:hypothetical protein